MGCFNCYCNDYGMWKGFIFQDFDIFKLMVENLFESVKNGFEMVIYLTGALCLWMGIMNIGEEAGIVSLLYLG